MVKVNLRKQDFQNILIQSFSSVEELMEEISYVLLKVANADDTVCVRKNGNVVTGYFKGCNKKYSFIVENVGDRVCVKTT